MIFILSDKYHPSLPVCSLIALHLPTQSTAYTRSRIAVRNDKLYLTD